MSMRVYLGCALACASAGLSAAPASSWVQVAEQALHDQLHATYPDVVSWTLTPMLSDRQATLSDAGSNVQVDLVKLGKRSALQVSWAEGERKIRQAVWFAVAGEQPALLLGADVGTRQPIPVDVVRADEHAPWDPTCEVMSPSTSLQGMRTRKALRAGEVLCNGDMEPKPPVSRGEQVVVHSSAGLVTVVSTGIADADGAIGERLRVRNPSSGEFYLAFVSAAGEVVVRQ